jgi:NADPH:quinone reductase-like Zn-dependent oxidoreductase
MCAVQLAQHAGARVIGTVRSVAEEPVALAAGAREVVLNDQKLGERVKALVPEGVAILSRWRLEPILMPMSTC